MVNRIDIEVSARGNFSQLNAQIAELKAAVAQLQSKPLLGDTGRATTAQLAQIQTQFDKMLLATRAFNVETVKMSNAVDNFGNRLQAGKLHFSEYARIYSQTMKGMRTELDSLAEAQARVAKSVILPDALKTGYARVITNLTSDLKTLNAAEEAAIIKTRALNSVIHGMGTSLVNMGKNTQWAGRQLTVGLTVPVAAFGAMAAKVFKDVNTELTRMQRMYGTGLTLPSEQEISKVSAAIIDLSKKVAENMGIAQKETVTAAANFAAVGTTGDALITATEQAMRLSKLGAVNADTAQKTITSLQTTFRVGTKDVAEAVNFLNDIQKQTSTDLQDLTDAIPRVGPIVAQLGGTYKDTAVMMVAMKEAGVPAAQSANAIKSAVASMIGPTRQARDEFEKYGISLTKIKDDTQGNPIKMVEALQDSLKKLSPLVQAQLIEKLFGKFQFARVTALIDNLGRAGSQTQNAFLVAKASAGELAKLANQEMKIATESTTAKWSRALEGFKATLMPLGEKFMKFGTKVLDFFSKVMHFLDKFKPLENFLVSVLGGAAIIGPVLMLVGLFGNLVGNIIKGVNYFRMFAQGVKSGGIVEGFRSMANFFEMINIETLASSKNMDGLTTSTEKTVKAFEVLNQEIGIMTRSLNEVFARSSRMPIIASPYAQQTLSELQYTNPNYNKNAGATEGIERPHMFPAARTWGGWISNEQNIQGQHLMLQRFLSNPSMFPSTSDQESWMRKGTSEQWGRPVPAGGLAAELQKKFGKEDVIYGPKFGVQKEEVYTRGFQKLQMIKDEILTGQIAADSKAAAEMEKIAAMPMEEQTAALSAVIDRVVFSEEQYFRNLIETLVQSQALLSAPEEMLKTVDVKIKSVMSDPTIADKPAEIQKVISDFNRDFKLLGGTIVEDISAYRLLVEQAIISTNSAFEAAIVAAEFRAGIVTGAEMSGGIRRATLGKIASMDKHPLEQALGFTREVPKGFQTGGAIHAQDGVWVPGTGSGDRVPAMLEPGEFVVNRNAAKQYGGLLEHLNWKAAPRFGSGGKNPSSAPVGIRGYVTGDEVDGLPKPHFAHIQERLDFGSTEDIKKALMGYLMYTPQKNSNISKVISHFLSLAETNPELLKGFRFVGNMGLDVDEEINTLLRTKGVSPVRLIQNLNDRYNLTNHPYEQMLKAIGLSDNEIDRVKPILHRNITKSLSRVKIDSVNDPYLYNLLPRVVEGTLKSTGFESAIPKLYAVREVRTPGLLLKDVERLGLKPGYTWGTSTKSRFFEGFRQTLLSRQKGGGIPGYQSGLTTFPELEGLRRPQQEKVIKDYVSQYLPKSTAMQMLESEILSAVTPSQLGLLRSGYGTEVMAMNPELKKVLEKYTILEQVSRFRPGRLPEKGQLNIMNTKGLNERFLLEMTKNSFESWHPKTMLATSPKSELFTVSLAQAIKEQYNRIGGIGIAPEELSLSPYSERLLKNLQKRGMQTDASMSVINGLTEEYDKNDYGFSDAKTVTRGRLDILLRKITNGLFNDFLYVDSPFTTRSNNPFGAVTPIVGAKLSQIEALPKISEIEARKTLMGWLKANRMKLQSGGGIPGYEEGGGPTWMARGNPYTEEQFQKALESWIRPVLHGMAPWNNPGKETYRPMGEIYNGFFRDIFNDQMRNIGRQDLLRAMVVDNVKGGANMHPWITNLVNAANDRYYPPEYQPVSGNRVPAMENYQGPWIASTTRPFTSFTDIKDTTFLKKRFMPDFNDKRFWNAMVRGNKLPFFFHAMTGPETMGLPVSKLFAGQTYYGNEGEYVLPQGQKFPLTGYSSDLATRLPIVHSIAPGSTKMINGVRIPVAQTGGMIPGFTEGLTVSDYFQKTLTGRDLPVPGIMSGPFSGSFETISQLGEKQEIFVKTADNHTMALEAFINQLHRGLGGSNAAIDQVVSRFIGKNLNQRFVLRSPLLRDLVLYDKWGGVPIKDFDPEQGIRRYLESILVGNKDLHGSNFGFRSGATTISDSGEHFLQQVGYYKTTPNSPEQIKKFIESVSATSSVLQQPEIRAVGLKSLDLLAERGIDTKAYVSNILEEMKSKISEDFISGIMLKATGRNPEIIDALNKAMSIHFDKPFVPMMTDLLKTRLSRMSNPFFTLQKGGNAWVPGFGEGDKVPAMLEPGEYVINKNAAKQYGGLLEDINFNKAPRFADGGSAFSRMVGRVTPGGIDTFGQYAKIITSMIPTVATQMAKDFAAGLRMGVSPNTYQHYSPLSAADQLGVKLANMNHLLPQWLSGGVSAFKTGMQNPDVAFKNVPAHFNKLSTLAVNTGGSIGKLGDFARSAGKLISSSFKDGVSAFKTGLQNPSYFKQTPSYFSGVQKFGYNMGALAPAALGNITNKIISAGEFLKQQISTFRTGFQNPSYVGRTPEYFSRMERMSYTIGALMRPAGWKVLGNVMGDAIKSKITYAGQWLTGKLPNIDRAGAWQKVKAIELQTAEQVKLIRFETEEKAKEIELQGKYKAREIEIEAGKLAGKEREAAMKRAAAIEIEAAQKASALRLVAEEEAALVQQEAGIARAAQLQIVDTPRSGPLGLLDRYRQFRPEIGPEGEPVRDPATGKIKSKAFKGGMGSMIGGQMIGMLGMQVAGGMKEGGAKSAVNMASMGAMMGSMFGPEGVAIGAVAGAALGFATDAIKKESEKIKNAAAAYQDSIQLSSTSLHNLGIKIRDFSNISFSAATKLGTSVSKIDEYATAYTNAQDEETKSTLAYLKLKAQEGDTVALATWAQQKYNTAVAAGAKPSEVLADIAGELKAGGVSGTISQGILLKGGIKRSKSAVEAFKSGQNEQIAGVDFNKNFLDPTAYVKAQGVGGYWSNYGKAWTGGMKSIFDVKTLTSDPSQYLKNYLESSRAFGGAFAGRTSEKYSDQATKRMMTQQAQLFAIDPDKMLKMQSKLSGMTKTITESKDGFKAWNTELTKMMPDVGKFNTQLSDAGFNTKRLYTLSAMQANGMNLTNQQYLNAAGNLDAYNAALARYATMQALSKGDSAMNKIAEERQAKYDASLISGNQKATDNTQNQIYALENLNKSRQKEIDSIAKEMDTRQKEYDQQQKVIDQQKALADLKDSITRAAASGDLIAMASAQSSYNEELAKQQALNEKEKKDNADQARINKIDSAMRKTQEDIDKLQKHLNDLGKTLNDTFKTPEVKNFAEGMSAMEQTIKELASTGKYKNIPELIKGALSDKSIQKLIDDGLIKSEDIAKYLGLNENDLKDALDKAYKAVKKEDKDLKVKLKEDNGGWLDSLLGNPNIKGVTNTFRSIGIVIGDIFGTIGKAIGDTVGGWGSSIATAISGAWASAMSSIKTLWTNFTQTEFGAALQKGLGNFSKMFIKPLTSAFGSIKTFWQEQFSGIRTYWADWRELGPNQMADKIEKFIKDLPGKFTSGLEGLKTAFKGIFKSIAEYWNSTMGSLKLHVYGTNKDVKFPSINMDIFNNKADGGYIRGPGDSTSDSIPARLSNGEYVVKASSVARYGTSFLDGINEQKFANGGPVGKSNNYGSWWSAIFDSSNRERKGFWGSGVLHDFVNPFVQLGRFGGYQAEKGLRNAFAGVQNMGINMAARITGHSVNSNIQGSKNSLFKNNPYATKDGGFNMKNYAGDAALASLNFAPMGWLAKPFKAILKPIAKPIISGVKDVAETIMLGAKSIFGPQLSPALSGIPKGLGSSKGASRLFNTAFDHSSFLKEIRKLAGSSGINKTGLTGKYLVQEGGLSWMESEYFLKELKSTTGMEFEAFWNQFVRAIFGPEFAMDQKLFAILTKDGSMKNVLGSKFVSDFAKGDRSSKSPSKYLWQYMLSKLTGNWDLHSSNLIPMNKYPFIVDSGASMFTNADGSLFPVLREDKDFGQHEYLEDLAQKATRMFGKTKTKSFRSDLLEFFDTSINKDLVNYAMEMAFPGKENLAHHSASLDRHMARISNGKYKSFSEAIVAIMKQRFTTVPLLPGEDKKITTFFGIPRKDGGIVGENKNKSGYGSWWSAIFDSSNRERKGFWGSGVLHDLVNPYVELGRGFGYSMEEGFRHAIFGKNSKYSKNQGFEDNPFRGKDGAKRLFGDVMLAWGAPKLIGKATQFTKPLWHPLVNPVSKIAKKGLSWAGKGLSKTGNKIWGGVKNLTSAGLRALDKEFSPAISQLSKKVLSSEVGNEFQHQINQQMLRRVALGLKNKFRPQNPIRTGRAISEYMSLKDSEDLRNLPVSKLDLEELLDKSYSYDLEGGEHILSELILQRKSRVVGAIKDDENILGLMKKREDIYNDLFSKIKYEMNKEGLDVDWMASWINKDASRSYEQQAVYPNIRLEQIIAEVFGQKTLAKLMKKSETHAEAADLFYKHFGLSGLMMISELKNPSVLGHFSKFFNTGVRDIGLGAGHIMGPTEGRATQILAEMYPEIKQLNEAVSLKSLETIYPDIKWTPDTLIQVMKTDAQPFLDDPTKILGLTKEQRAKIMDSGKIDIDRGGFLGAQWEDVGAGFMNAYGKMNPNQFGYYSYNPENVPLAMFENALRDNLDPSQIISTIGYVRAGDTMGSLGLSPLQAIFTSPSVLKQIEKIVGLPKGFGMGREAAKSVRDQAWTFEETRQGRGNPWNLRYLPLMEELGYSPGQLIKYLTSFKSGKPGLYDYEFDRMTLRQKLAIIHQLFNIKASESGVSIGIRAGVMNAPDGKSLTYMANLVERLKIYKRKSQEENSIFDNWGFSVRVPDFYTLSQSERDLFNIFSKQKANVLEWDAIKRAAYVDMLEQRIPGMPQTYFDRSINNYYELWKSGKLKNVRPDMLKLFESILRMEKGRIKKADGGYISGPGGPKADLIPAMLSNGEYVIQSAAVNKYGQSMLDAINSGNFGPKYATGGIIKSYNVGGSTNDSSLSLPAPQYNVNIVVNGANASADDIADMVATRFRREAESMSTGRSLRA